jgi:hypothetical protein
VKRAVVGLLGRVLIGWWTDMRSSRNLMKRRRSRRRSRRSRRRKGSWSGEGKKKRLYWIDKH